MKVEEVVAPVIEETIVTPEPVVEPVVETTEVLGVVAGCEKLNVRSAPNTDANIVTVLAAGTEVMIDEAESTADFYKVVTGAGVEGFCMKKFINIA